MLLHVEVQTVKSQLLSISEEKFTNHLILGVRASGIELRIPIRLRRSNRVAIRRVFGVLVRILAS
jgi:hypothetical protein